MVERGGDFLVEDVFVVPGVVGRVGEDGDVGEVIVEFVEVGEDDHGFVAFVFWRVVGCVLVVGDIGDDLHVGVRDGNIFGPGEVAVLGGCEDKVDGWDGF